MNKAPAAADGDGQKRGNRGKRLKSLEVIHGTNLEGLYAPGRTPARVGTGPSADMTGRDPVSMLVNRRRSSETRPSGYVSVADRDPLLDIYDPKDRAALQSLLPRATEEAGKNYRNELTDAGADRRTRFQGQNALELERLRQTGKADAFKMKQDAALQLAKLEAAEESPSEKTIFDQTSGDPMWIENLFDGSVSPHPVAARKAFSEAMADDGAKGAAREIEMLHLFKGEKPKALARLLLLSAGREDALEITNQIRNPLLKREYMEMVQSIPDPVADVAGEIKEKSGIVGRTAGAVSDSAQGVVRALAGEKPGVDAAGQPTPGSRGPLSEGSRFRQNVETGMGVGQILDPFGLGRFPRKGAQFWLSLPRWLKTSWDYWSARPENRGRSFEDFEAESLSRMGGADVATP